MTLIPTPLPAGEWHADDVKDAAIWTVELTARDHAELGNAVALAKAVGRPLTEITREQFPLASLAEKLARIERELIDGRGFVLLRKLEAKGQSPEDLTLMLWGIGAHLGFPSPQNNAGDLITDVLVNDPTLKNFNPREETVAGMGYPHHTDGSDIIGLMCLGTPRSGGVSFLASTVAIYNHLCGAHPDLLAALHEEFPFDFRGEHEKGGKGFYMCPIFTIYHGRLFVRFLADYIRTSQRHPDAPRLNPLAQEAVDVLSATVERREFNVEMTFEPGDIQFINNHRVLHGRTPYWDAPELGFKRHLKRIWLVSPHMIPRPKCFTRATARHWEKAVALRKRSVQEAMP